MNRLTITYRKSVIGYAKDQRATIAALGLKRLNHSVVHDDVATIRGMVHKVRHLVDVNGAAADSVEGIAALSGAST